jgi:uncharacterized protein
MHLKGKPAFDRETENEAFIGLPQISVTRLTEENDIVIAEGGRIRRLISYLVTVT